MAITGRGQKSAFLHELFRDNPKVSFKEAGGAWKAAGNEGDLSSNTFYNTKAAFKKKGGDVTPDRADFVPTPTKAKTPARKVSRGKTEIKSPSAPEHAQNVAPAPENGRSIARVQPVGQEAPTTGDRDRVFDEVEAGIDDLIFRLKLAGGAPEIEARLREVRRSLHPSQR